LEENFHRAIQIFIQQTLNKKKPRDRQYIYMQPGGDYVFQKLMMQSPVEHLHRFKEMIRMAVALPAGDMHPPNQALQLEWVYMSFHKEDRAKYVESGQCLADEILESLAEYFDNIFNSQVADGSLAKKRERQIKQCVRCKMRHELCKRYNEKVRQVTEQRYRGDGCHNKWPDKYCRSNFKWQDRGNCDRRDTYDKRDKKRDDKTPPDCSDKAFKPCSVHGPKSKHTSEECYKNPRNDKRQLQDKKRPHEAHHNDAHYTSNDDELCSSVDTPVPSEDPVSASSKSEKDHEDENYHLHVSKKMKAGCHVPCKSDHQRQRSKFQSSQKGKKREMPPTFLDNDLDFTDTVLMGLDSMDDAVLKGPDDVTNPFDFNL
jgi:hypothetical protein